MCHPGAQERHFWSLQFYPEEQFAFLKWHSRWYQLGFAFITDTLKPEKNKTTAEWALTLTALGKLHLTYPLSLPVSILTANQEFSSSDCLRGNRQTNWTACVSVGQGCQHSVCWHRLLSTGNCLLSLGHSWYQNRCPWQYLTCKHLQLFPIVWANKKNIRNINFSLAAEMYLQLHF